MKVCIAGGGRVGMYLAQSLLSHHHKVTIIEPQEALCRTLADTLDIPVICGDSLSFDTLRTADVASCDAFVAVTGNDEDNLVACQIAKREFGVDRTVARASNPKNRELLHTLGVDTVVCGTDNLSHILEREIETDTIRQLLSLGGGTASLNEILLALAVSAASNDVVAYAMSKLSLLKGCEAHCTHMVGQEDESFLLKLRVNLTCSPHFPSKDLFYQ